MASEEQYLDDLLNNAINSEPRERSMKDVMRKMGIVIEEPVAEEIPMPEADLTMPELQEAPLAEDISSVDLDDMLSQLEGMEVSDNSVSLDETVPVEEPVIEETTSESVTPEISAITQETLADMLDVLDDPSTYMNEVVPDISIEELSAALETPMQEEIPAVEEVSQPEVTLADEIGQDDLDAMLAGFDVPETAPEVEEAPVIEDIPVMEEAPVIEDISVMEEAPIMEDIPIMEEAPVMEDIPIMEEAPVIEDIPVMEEAPVMEDIPVMEEAPIMEDIPIMEENPAIEEPIIEEPIIDEVPALEEPTPAPAAESAPMGKMSQEEMDALIAGMTGGDAPAEEPVVEEPAIEEPIIEEPIIDEVPALEEPTPTPVAESAPMGKMSQEEMDALIAGMTGGDAPAEEPAVDEPAIEEPIIEESIIEEPAIEEPAVEEPIIEEPSESVSDNPSDDELLKMLGEATTAEDFVMPESRLTDNAESDINISDEIIFDEVPTDEISTDEIQTDDVATEGITEEITSAENDFANEAPVDLDVGNASQDELMAMLAGLGLDDTPSEEQPAEPEADITDSNSSGAEETPVDLNDVEKLEAAGESDEDLLALLEGIDPTAANDVSSEPSQIIEPYEADGKLPKPKKKKKGFSLPLFGKKKKKGAEEESNLSEGDGVIAGTDEEIDDILAGMNEAETQDVPEENADGIQEVDLAEAMGDFDELAGIKEKKKPGFFARLLAFLTEDLDEEETTAGAALDEMSNDDILAEVDAETAAVEEKKNKKAKKDKKGKKKAAASEPSEAGEEGEEGEEGAADNGKKKKKKEKKVKEPKEPKPKEPKKIVLSKKANIGLFCFCVTIIAAVVILSNILPDYIEKNAARKAYYQGDYRTVYENFMNKQLNDSDTIIFKRAETIMKLQRRLDSYNNRIAMGQDAEALDSLLEGVYVYNKLSSEDTVGVVNDLTPIYMQIVDILQNKYNLSAQEAVSIYNIEDDTEYTRILFEIVRTGVYTLSVPETEENIEQSIEEITEQNSDEATEQNSDESNDVDENTDETPEEPARDDSEYRTIEIEDMLPQEEDLL